MALPGFNYSDIKTELEVKFIQFFHKIIESEIGQNGDILSSEILNSVKNAYTTQSFKKGVPYISFSSPATRCAYLYQYAPCFASAVAYDFQELLKRNLRLFKRVMLQDTLTISFLGGGPGTELVAIAKILENLLWKYPGAGKPLILNAIIIDADTGWEQTAELLLRYISSLLNTSLMKIKLTFIHANLASSFSKDVKKVITRSDMVTMVRFLPAVCGRKAKNKIARISQNVMRALKPGALLFVLDSVKELHNRIILLAAQSFNNLKQIYSPGLEKFHILSIKSIKKIMDLYYNHYNIAMCLTNCFTFCAGWIKKEIVSSDTVVNGSKTCNSFAKKRHRRRATYSKRLQPLSKSPLDPESKEIPACNILDKSHNSWHKKEVYNTWKQMHCRQKIGKLFIKDFEKNLTTEDTDDENDSYMDCEMYIDMDYEIYFEKTLNATKSKHQRMFPWPVSDTKKRLLKF